jgi:chromosome segregation ATPase
MKIQNLLFVLPLLWLGCASEPERKNLYSANSGDQPLVEGKYSLAADRAKLDEARKEIPPERKQFNDELALILQLTNEVKKPPYEIRNKFDETLRKKRELFDKDMTKSREQYSNQERKNRDEFLKQQTKIRDEYSKEKHSREERTEFFRNLDEKRQDYFANEREKRNDFESDVRDKRKNFEDYTREKNNEFNQEYRAYSRKYDDMKKEEKASPTKVKSLDQEIDEARTQKGSHLGTEE